MFALTIPFTWNVCKTLLLQGQPVHHNQPSLPGSHSLFFSLEFYFLVPCLFFQYSSFFVGSRTINPLFLSLISYYVSGIVLGSGDQ